jgi:hypothetical protein
MCRKSHGSAFATYVAAPAASVRTVRGADRATRYESSPRFVRPFCSGCGSVLPFDPEEGRVFMAAGCLDDDPGVRPVAHIFVKSKAPWYEIRGDLPRFDAYPPGMGETVTGPARAPAPRGRVGGSCLCGGVAYELAGPLELVVDCHCSRCRKGRSAAFASNLLVNEATFQWLRGEDLVRSYRVPEAKVFANCFCATCGSILPRVAAERGIVVVPAGTLDDDPGARERLHIYVASKAPWYELPDDGLPRFDEAPPQVP